MAKTRIDAFQQDDGQCIATVTDEDTGRELWRTWPHGDEANARLTAYVWLTGTPLRSHRVGGGYQR